MKWSRILLLVAGIVFLPCLMIRAQSSEQKDESKNSLQLESETQEAPLEDSAIKLFVDKIEVLGRLEKPQAVFIVPGSDPKVDDIRIERSFFSEIFRPVEKGGRRGVPAVKQVQERRKDFIPW